MLLTAIEPFTLIDFPGKVSCVLFTFGCNFKCGYCHNPELVKPKKHEFSRKNIIAEDNIMRFLEQRREFLDGVVICGGEPTIQPGIIDFLQKIKSKNFAIKLDTNGFKPEILKIILAKELIDYIAMDIKASKELYDVICGVNIDFTKIELSKNLIMNSGIDYHFRTTVIKGVHNQSEVRNIAKFCQNASKYVIQNFNNKKTLNSKFRKFSPFLYKELVVLKKIAQEFVNTEILSYNDKGCIYKA
mgnify:CR=1 FL=1